MDMGSYSAAVLWRSIQVWRFRPILVCQWRNRADPSFCYHRHRIEEKSTKCTCKSPRAISLSQWKLLTGVDLPRSDQGSIWHTGSPCLHSLWSHDQYSRDSHVIDWRFRCGLDPHRHAYSGSLFSATFGRHSIHHVWGY